MPTYTWRCERCGRVEEHMLTMGEYIRRPPGFFCCAQLMPRFFTLDPLPANANAMASERHYDGLRAPDGTPIDTRAKHREYMRANNLTTADDYTQTWRKAAQERTDRMAGKDAGRAGDIAEAVRRLGG